jgi:molybdopterin converting factor small subunit
MDMLIKVKVIGRYRDIIGKQELELKVPNGDTIWHVIDVLIKLYPKIAKDKKFIMVSKNNTYTTKDEKVRNGDEITLSPPVVSGG